MFGLTITPIDGEMNQDWLRARQTSSLFSLSLVLIGIIKLLHCTECPGDCETQASRRGPGSGKVGSGKCLAPATCLVVSVSKRAN